MESESHDNEPAHLTIMKAADELDVGAVHTLLDQGVNLDDVDETGSTALMRASESGKAEVVHLLLDNGANVNLGNCDKKTALMLASEQGHTGVVQFLLDNGADVNMQDKDGETVLMKASSKGYKDIVHMLLGNGADVNMKNKEGGTALMKASSTGHKDVILMLLKNHADVNMKDNEGETALFKAIYYGDTHSADTLDTILEYCQNTVPLECIETLCCCHMAILMDPFCKILTHYLIYECTGEEHFMSLIRLKGPLHWPLSSSVIEALYLAGCPASLIHAVYTDFTHPNEILQKRRRERLMNHPQMKALREMEARDMTLYMACFKVIWIQLVKSRNVNRVRELPLPQRLTDQFKQVQNKIKYLCDEIGLEIKNSVIVCFEVN